MSNLLHQQLPSMPKFGSGIGLHRVAQIWQRLAQTNPTQDAAYIKVTGSNGKGSTCAIIDAILRQLPIKTACFTSPHLFRFNERICVSGQPISEDQLQSAFNTIQTQVNAWQPSEERFGAFEIFTLLAQYHFQRLNAHHGVFEVGIGGRYDPVRTIPGHICALTSLDLEHTQLLGNSLELIACEKLDLCPTGGSMVLFPGIDTDLWRRLTTYAELRQVQLYRAEILCQISALQPTPTGYGFNLQLGDWSLQDLQFNLFGAHQLRNAQVALGCLYLYGKHHLANISADAWQSAIRAGLESVQLSGRAAHLPGDPPCYYDIGHTPAAVSCFAEWLKTHLAAQAESLQVTLVLGISADKDLKAIAAPLCALADHVICTQASKRAAPAEQVAKAVAKIAPNLPCQQTKDIHAAIALAREQAKATNSAVVCAGGLFLAIEAAQIWQGRSLDELNFF